MKLLAEHRPHGSGDFLSCLRPFSSELTIFSGWVLGGSWAVVACQGSLHASLRPARQFRRDVKTIMGAMLGNPSRILFLVSNAYAFYDACADLVRDLANDPELELYVVSSAYGLSARKVRDFNKNFLDLGFEEADLVVDFAPPSRGGALIAKARRYTRFAWELSYWLRNLRKHMLRDYHSVVWLTENSFSDLVGSRILRASGAVGINLWFTFPPSLSSLNPSAPAVGRSSPSSTMGETRNYWKFGVAAWLDTVLYRWPSRFWVTALSFGAMLNRRGRISFRVPNEEVSYLVNSSRAAASVLTTRPGSLVTEVSFGAPIKKIPRNRGVGVLGIVLGSQITNGTIDLDQLAGILFRCVEGLKDRHQIEHVLIRAHPRYPKEALAVAGAFEAAGRRARIFGAEASLKEFAHECEVVVGGYSASLMLLRDWLGTSRVFVVDQLLVATGVGSSDLPEFSTVTFEGEETQVLAKCTTDSRPPASQILRDLLS